MIPRFHRLVCDLYGAIGVKAGVNSISLFDLTETIPLSRPNFPWPLPRSGRQGWPKAMAKRLALDGREHSVPFGHASRHCEFCAAIFRARTRATIELVPAQSAIIPLHQPAPCVGG